MSKFNIGDRVIAITAVDGNKDTLYKTGVIRAIDIDDRWDVICEFDEDIYNGYNPRGCCESDDRGWCGCDDEFDLLYTDKDITPVNLKDYEKII